MIPTFYFVYIFSTKLKGNISLKWKIEMFSFEKVEPERFDLIRKTPPHIPHFSFEANFCQRQRIPTKHLAPFQLALPTRGARPGPPADGGPAARWGRRGRGCQPLGPVPAVPGEEQKYPEVSPSACLVPISGGCARWDVPKHHRARGGRINPSRAGSGALPAHPQLWHFFPNIFTWRNSTLCLSLQSWPCRRDISRRAPTPRRCGGLWSPSDRHRTCRAQTRLTHRHAGSSAAGSPGDRHLPNYPCSGRCWGC